VKKAFVEVYSPEQAERKYREFVYHSLLNRMQFLQQAMVAYFQKQRHTYRLTVCGKHDEALRYLTGTGKNDDIFFFDFSDFSTGIRLASCLREQRPRASWVYMDGTAENLYSAMLLQPSAYIPDSGNSGAVFTALQRLERYHQTLQKRYYFSFKCDGEYLRIPFEDIRYFESSAKKVKLQPTKSEKHYFFAAKLDDIAGRLPDYFLRCHQSYLVNMHMIRRLDTQNHVFWLHSNEEILISRRNYREAKERYQRFLEEHA